MATFTVTISNSLNVFGPAPSDKWEAFNWGSFLWGEGTADLQTIVFKLLTNSLTPDTAVGKEVRRIIQNALTVDADMGFEQLLTANGYAYVFPNHTTNAEERDFPDWTSATAGAPTWASQSVATTSWS